MVDLISQYQKIKPEVDAAIQTICSKAEFINGSEVKSFEKNIAQYLNVNNAIACANGTDALQIALMALGLSKGDEVIVPAFTYVATAEVIALLGLTPIMVDVDIDTFNTGAELIEASITSRTKAIVPVHLFGQSTDMEDILVLAKKHNLYVIEDNAQAIAAEYTFSDGTVKKTGTLGDISTTSFFPSKNLGCYGDGGAIFTDNDEIASTLRMIANHGQNKRYHHAVVGCNSRLDSIQAAVLNIKLKQLDMYNAQRRAVASQYDLHFSDIEQLMTPVKSPKSTHVYHQYTLRVTNGKRDELVSHLNHKNIPCGIYYPIPLYKQKAFASYVEAGFSLSNTEKLCTQVLSLPIHTEMSSDTLAYIATTVKEFFTK